MREYSPKRRTAVVFTGTGTTGAYHAGVLRALDESGVKIDLVVGSGTGAITAAFAAVSGGAGLYGKGGLWDGASWRAFYRLRPALRAALLLLGVSFAIIRPARAARAAAGDPVPAAADRRPCLSRVRLARPLGALGGARGPERSLPGRPGGPRARARGARRRGARHRLLAAALAHGRGVRGVPRRRAGPRSPPARPVGDRPRRRALGRSRRARPSSGGATSRCSPRTWASWAFAS